MFDDYGIRLGRSIGGGFGVDSGFRVIRVPVILTRSYGTIHKIHAKFHTHISQILSLFGLGLLPSWG